MGGLTTYRHITVDQMEKALKIERDVNMVKSTELKLRGNCTTSILLSCILRYVLTDTAGVLGNLVLSTVHGLQNCLSGGGGWWPQAC